MGGDYSGPTGSALVEENENEVGVTLRMGNGEEIETSVDPSVTVHTLHKQLSELLGVPSYAIRVCLRTHVLSHDQDRTLESHNIGEGDLLQLVVVLDAAMRRHEINPLAEQQTQQRRRSFQAENGAELAGGGGEQSFKNGG